MMAEVLGRRTGCAGNKGGSMHMTDASIGILGANGIVAGRLPTWPPAPALRPAHRLWPGHHVLLRRRHRQPGHLPREPEHGRPMEATPVCPCAEQRLGDLGVAGQAPGHQGHRHQGAGYGMARVIVAVTTCLTCARPRGGCGANARRGEGPTLLECKTYRYGSHHVGIREPLYRSTKVAGGAGRRTPSTGWSSVLSSGIMTEAGVDQVRKAGRRDRGRSGVRDEQPMPVPRRRWRISSSTARQWAVREEVYGMRTITCGQAVTGSPQGRDGPGPQGGPC